MPTTLTNGIQLPDKGSVDWYSSMQSNYNLIDTHLGDTDIHVTTEDKSRWDGKANASHTHTSSELTDIGDYATKQYVDTSISGLVDNAPAALDTLKELSTALNDDANFASTVTTALSAKANSADLATVATSGSYNDLSNKPTINDSTITIQKNGSTVDTFTTNGSNKTINIPVPTKTSDLTNDSNFVNTSNSAVASGITSAKVTDYDTHIADTDIHVTSADKQKWNDNASQSYVLRYSSTAITDNSTIAYSTLDNTDNIKASDKIIDSDGKIFSVVSVDSDNSTVTVGSALIDLALDANVMHLSGNETSTGDKNFIDDVSVKMLTTTGKYISDEGSTNRRTVLKLLAGARDTDGYSCSYVTRVRSNKAQGALISSDVQTLGFDFVENQVRTLNTFIIRATGWLNDVPQKIEFTSNISDYTYGNSTNKAKINDLNPGALSFPDLSAGLDISGYITLGSSDNTYTPPVDGWISIYGYGNACALKQNNLYAVGQYVSESGTTNRLTGCMLCVKGGVSVDILLRTVTSLSAVYFYPCLGNV